MAPRTPASSKGGVSALSRSLLAPASRQDRRASIGHADGQSRLDSGSHQRRCNDSRRGRTNRSYSLTSGPGSRGPSRGTSPMAAPASPVGGDATHDKTAFYVPDLSEMDPFSLMERGLVEEVTHFRSDPKSYFEAQVLPRVAVRLPPPPPVQPTPVPTKTLPASHHNSPSHQQIPSEPPSPTAAMKPTPGTVHGALMPKCVNRLLVAAREARRQVQMLNSQRDAIAQREAEGFGARIPDLELLGSYALSAHSQTLDADALIVPLLDAEQYLRDLQKAISSIKAGASIGGADDDAAASPTGLGPKKKSDKKTTQAEVAQQLAAAQLAITKPSPQHRRTAVETLTRHHDECSAIVQERNLHIRFLRQYQQTSPGGSPDPDMDQPRTGGEVPSVGTSDAVSSSLVVTADESAEGPGQQKRNHHARVGYAKGLCMAARDLADLYSKAAAAGLIDLGDASPSSSPVMGEKAALRRGNANSIAIAELNLATVQPNRSSVRLPSLTSVERIASQYGKVMEQVEAYIVYGLWHQPHTAVSELLLRWLDNRCHSHPSLVPTASRTPLWIGSNHDKTLLDPNKVMAGAGWQRHPTRGAVTVVLLSTGFQEVSYIKQHRNLPVIELRRCFNQGQMAKAERVYDLTFIPDHYGIRPVRPVVHPVVCGPRMEVVVELPPHVLLSCALESGNQSAVPGRSQTTTFIDRVGRHAKIHVLLFDASPCKLVVFARHPSELHYRRSSTVLLRPNAALWPAAGDSQVAELGRVGADAGRHQHDSSSPGPISTAGSPNAASMATVDVGLQSYPEQYEWFQARLGVLLCPRQGELATAACAAQDCLALEGTEATAAAMLPPGVQLGRVAKGSLHSGGTLFSFRCSIEAQEASIRGAHGVTVLHRAECWRQGAKAELRPRAGVTSPPDTAWFFGVAKLKEGSPVTLWLDGQCALHWSIAA
jgi:hypothetical protein